MQLGMGSIVAVPIFYKRQNDQEYSQYECRCPGGYATCVYAASNEYQ